MADKIKIADRVNPLFEDNEANWLFYYNAAKGGDDFINSAYLFTHRLEDAVDFDQRLERAYFLNFCDTIPSIYNSYIFKESIERAPDQVLDNFRNNVDGSGMNISDFICKVGYWASVFGVVHVIVDVPLVGTKTVTRKDVKDNKLAPYCKIIYPTQLVDWSIDPKGEFNWVIIKSSYNSDIDPTLERETFDHFKVITREQWWVEDEDGNKVKYDDGSPSEGTNELGMVPIITIYHKDDSDDKIGKSMLTDIARINRTIMNWCSCIDEQIERNTFSQLVVPDTGETSEEEGSDSLYKLGTSSIWTYDANAKNPPSFISPNVDNLTAIWGLVLDHIKEIYRLSGLQGGTSDLYTSRSGRQSQMSFSGVNSSLAQKAGTYERLENGISKLAYLFMKANIDQYQEVRYPREFDVTSLQEEIDNTFKIMERNFSAVLNKTLQKDIARKAIPTKPAALRKEIEDEIDAGTGIVEQKLNQGILPEKRGDGNTNTNLNDSFKASDDVKAQEKGKQKIE